MVILGLTDRMNLRKIFGAELLLESNKILRTFLAQKRQNYLNPFYLAQLAGID